MKQTEQDKHKMWRALGIIHGGRSAKGEEDSAALTVLIAIAKERLQEVERSAHVRPTHDEVESFQLWIEDPRKGAEYDRDRQGL